MSSEPAISEAPIMLRAKIRRDELDALRIIAIQERLEMQELLAVLIRERIAKENT